MAKNPWLALVVLGLAGLASQSASASTFKVLYSPCAQPGCADGRSLAAGLLRDPSGTLYGVAAEGGANNGGTVFALTPNGDDWQFQVLYSFCAQADCADGQSPRAELIEDAQGNLYGTTSSGSTQAGTVFKLTHDAARTNWTYNVIHTFCPVAGCADGQTPNSRLTYLGAASGAPYDGVSQLYGTTQTGGSTQGGVVYQLTPKRDGSWRYVTVYELCQGQACRTGYTPARGLIMDRTGNLFLNAQNGGDAGVGTLIELVHHHGRFWKPTQLYSFCAVTGCTDGSGPSGALAFDAAGNLFGTTAGGGTQSSGTLFEISPAGSTWNEQVLYNFCSKNRCKDGTPPVGVASDAAGGLIGAAAFGGRGQGSGTLFRFDAGAFQLVYQFCHDRHCSDGIAPESPPLADGAGNFFGTTYEGGTGGVIYEITP